MLSQFIIAVVIVVLLSGLRIAREYQRGVVFRLGRYTGLRGPGLYWIIPLGIERSVMIDIRTRTVSAERQETITRDSVTVKLNAVLWYHIVDAGKSVIAVSDAGAAVYQLALTSLRNIIGQHDLDEVLRERNKINGLLCDNIAAPSTRWGIEVERFEMKDVEQMANNPVAVELRRMQMVTEVGAENNSTTVLMIPSDFVSLAHSLNDYRSSRPRAPRRQPARVVAQEKSDVLTADLKPSAHRWQPPRA
jgi:regulator of protease activity HflC (stomatin/prohibitin superfamily)